MGPWTNASLGRPSNGTTQPRQNLESRDGLAIPLMGDVQDEEDEWDSSAHGVHTRYATGEPHSAQQPLSSLNAYIEGMVGVQKLKSWLRVSDPPTIQKIRPVFPRLEKWYLAHLGSIAARLPGLNIRPSVLSPLVCLAIWVCWATVVWLSLSVFRGPSSSFVAQYGEPIKMSCISRLWLDGNKCGLNGERCRPFDKTSFAFRCPSNCGGVKVLNTHAVGTQEIIYNSLVIGGGPVNELENGQMYRGDSFVCGAAIHAGVVKDQRGGCGVVSLIGQQSNFASNERNGIASVGFDSNFPLAFTFKTTDGSQGSEPRWLLPWSLLMSSQISAFSTSPAVFFAFLFPLVFIHVAFISDPPDLSIADKGSLLSVGLSRFLPAAFVAYVIYRFSVRRSLKQLASPFDKTILWLGGCWFGALNNYTFDAFVPIQRLTPHDLKQQPGAILALILILLILIPIIIIQLRAILSEGHLATYLLFYALTTILLLFLSLVPGLNLRIHHYIIALIFLPGTAIQTRPSLFFQGLLLGLFINGIARWGFASILQTPLELLEDGKLNTLLPELLAPLITDDASTISFSWKDIPSSFVGISALVNDVERFRTLVDDAGELGAMGVKANFTWTRLVEGEPEYFRFAFVRAGYTVGQMVGDYTRAGTWMPDGKWIGMEPGPS